MTDLAAARFDLIAPLLRRYKRRFTVLDLGAGINPYMAQRISQEFDCVYVAIEQDPIAPEELAKLGPKALWLRKKMSVADLERLGCCEHFDIVLALNILHHFGEEWERALCALDAMSDWMVVQAPSPGDTQTCGAEVTPDIHLALVQEGTLMGESVQFEGHCPRPIFSLVSCPVPLTMSSWTSPEDCIRAKIHSGFTNKSIQLLHKDGRIRPYIHGLNLWNFAQLNGQWPPKETVLQMIREFPLSEDNHGDITAHNFLLDGENLHLIDGHEGWEFPDADGLVKTERMMAEALA